MGARWVLIGTDSPPTMTVEFAGVAAGGWPRKRSRSSCTKRRSRRRPTRRAGSRPESLQRRIEASLTRRYRAASSVFSRLSLSMTLERRWILLQNTCELPWDRFGGRRLRPRHLLFGWPRPPAPVRLEGGPSPGRGLAQTTEAPGPIELHCTPGRPGLTPLRRRRR